LDAFAVDSNGGVVHDERVNRTWATGEQLQSQVKLIPTAMWVNIFPPMARMAAIAKAPDGLDIFAVDQWGNLSTTWRNKAFNNNQWHPWKDLTSGGLFPPGAPVAVVSRNPRHLDVFVVGNDGSIMSLWWDASSGWSKPFSISPQAATSPWDGKNGGALAAVARDNDHIDVFIVDNHLHIASAYWSTQQGQWSYGDWMSPNLSWGTYPGSELAVVSLNPNRLDVYFVAKQCILGVACDSDAYLYDLIWSGSWASTLQKVTDMPLAATSRVAAVTRKVDITGDGDRDSDHMDIFVVGTDGHLIHNQWRFGADNFLWNPSRNERLDATASTIGQVGAISPWPGTIEVGAQLPDGTLQKTWFEDVEILGIGWQKFP